MTEQSTETKASNNSYTPYAEDRLNKLNIGEIENLILSSKTSSNHARRFFIITLAYIETHQRFRENPHYKNADFQDYLYDKFHIRLGSYQKERRAFVSYPEEAIKFGPGMVTKVLAKCGDEKARIAIEEIRKADKSLKNGVGRKRINEIINKHSKKTEKTKTNAMKLAEMRKELDSAYEEIDRLNLLLNEKDEKDEQIQRLKETVKRLKTENAKLIIEVSTLKTEKERMQGLEEWLQTMPPEIVNNHLEGVGTS
jgi:hypothetical protein